VRQWRRHGVRIGKFLSGQPARASSCRGVLANYIGKVLACFTAGQEMLTTPYRTFIADYTGVFVTAQTGVNSEGQSALRS